jgi:pyruvate dehydrogenase E1 component beta subunit
MAKLTMVQALNLALMQEMEKDKTVLILGQDVGINGGVFRVTDGLIDKFGSERVIDTPLAESAILGSAMGMAIGGLKPVAEMQFSGFAYLMLPQLECNVSRINTRSRGKFSAPLVVRMPYGAGVRALEHHSESKEGYWTHTAGVKVVIPSGPRNARALLVAAIRDPDPVVFMEPKRSYRAVKEEVPDEEEVMEIGKAQVTRQGNDITVIAWGAMYHFTEKVADKLIEEGISVELIDLLTINPMDSKTIAESVQKTGRCVVVQEAQKTLGPASEIIALINEKAFDSLQAPIKRVTMYDIPMPGFGRELMYTPSPGRIERAIRETLEYI